MAELSPTIAVQLPTVTVLPHPRGGFKVRGSLGPRSFVAIVRHIPGRVAYRYAEAGEWKGKGWHAADDAGDVHRCLADLLLWVATPEVEGRMMGLARRAFPGDG
jgi:hypothetical protein